jgi:Lrp/AsnC family leucine-responsive transcriptional regulator
MKSDNTKNNLPAASHLDQYDLKILRALQADSRRTTKEIAAQVGLSVTPVYERIRRLENDGYIAGYSARLNANKLNRGLIVFCHVKLMRLNSDSTTYFTNLIRSIPEVVECYNTSGSFDYLLKIHAADMESYRWFILNTLGTLDSIGSLESSFVMDTVKENCGIPI